MMLEDTKGLSIILQNAFTLLELIIVMTIVGVLAAISLPRIQTMIEKVRSAEAKTELGRISRSMERCFAWNNSMANCYGGAVNLDIDFNESWIDPESQFQYSVPASPVWSPNNVFSVYIEAYRNDTNNPSGYYYDVHMILDAVGGYPQKTLCSPDANGQKLGFLAC